MEDNINQRLNAIDEHLDSCLKQIQDNVNNIRKRNEKWKQDTGKFHGNKNKLNEITDDKVSDDSENISDNHNGEIMMNNNKDDVVENGVSESDTLNSSSCLLYTSRCV